MDVNQACGYSGEVALCAAASQGQLGSCQILIKTGKADVNLINEKNGNSPLFIAVKEGHYAIVDLLLNNGASLERYVGIFYSIKLKFKFSAKATKNWCYLFRTPIICLISFANEKVGNRKN